jgi:DNA-binding CsgD family transcriptional regulator/methylmalonyl-CoA mutase cobalamin-binding subunit
MSTTAALAAAVELPAPRTGAMLVCAPERPGQQPLVAVADGTYETAQERVFWRESPEAEVLRLPLERPVATRQLRELARQSPYASAAPGLRALLRAVQDSHEDSHDDSHEDGALSQALQAGDADLAFAEAVLLWKQAGLAQAYQGIGRCLSQLASSWAAGTGSVLAEHRATRVATQVTDRLAAMTPAPARAGMVVLAVPGGEQHTFALSALAHLLRDAGWRTQVVEDLPLHELTALATAPETTAVVLSVHTATSATDLRRLIAAVRGAAPGVLIAVGGPGLPGSTSTLGADLLSTDVELLLRRLGSGARALTERESQVLTLVADGLTNVEIAERLGVAPTTVKSHLDRILAKTSTEHRAGAVAVALRQRWIT